MPNLLKHLIDVMGSEVELQLEGLRLREILLISMTFTTWLLKCNKSQHHIEFQWFICTSRFHFSHDRSSNVFLFFMKLEKIDWALLSINFISIGFSLPQWLIAAWNKRTCRDLKRNWSMNFSTQNGALNVHVISLNWIDKRERQKNLHFRWIIHKIVFVHCLLNYASHNQEHFNGLVNRFEALRLWQSSHFNLRLHRQFSSY